MIRLAIALFVMFLAGCAAVHKIDRGAMTDFEMVSPDEWQMRVTTAINYPPESEKAEAIRMKWIREHTEANGCASFEVKSRQWTKSAGSVSDKVGTMTYSGTCLR